MSRGKTINSLTTIAVELLNFAEFPVSGMALLLVYLLGNQKIFLYSSTHFQTLSSFRSCLLWKEIPS